ncbi:HesA/MoeB/ThiF family protein [Pseudomonas aeruginosa]|uniref:HesA/MoeB/ThiF family protein n=2 Tax=Pseudomonas aeruginosa TaxID=287 RepID=UPI0021C9CD97|nr:ThiF family adenylyltransferase [Pseudomonas aeruginosa]
MRLHVEPSPWLVWPHAMKSGLCLHGFQERPVTGSPEYVVSDSLRRLGAIVSLSQAGSCASARKAEFQGEIASYWGMQHHQTKQNLLLLNRPQQACELFALSDPRQTIPSGQETVWLSTDTASLKSHYKRMVGRRAKVRAPETPCFYIKLQSHPDVQAPLPEHLLAWISPHVDPNDAERLISWFANKSSLSNRWIALELPGAANSPIYCLNVLSGSVKPNRGTRFGLRAARRRTPVVEHLIPTIIRSSNLDVLDRTEIHSRDLSGTAQRLKDAHVVCVGVGSLGSTVAMQLARSGVGRLTLIDPDTLEAPNLGRHVLGTDELGRSKAVALRDRIRRDLPTIDVDALPTFLELALYEHSAIFERADLVIVTTADWHSEDALWRAKSAEANWGLLQAWSEPHSLIGHALLAPAGLHDARHLFTENGEFKYRCSNWPAGGIIPLPGCGQSFIPGGSLGMANIASMVAQAAVALLSGEAAQAFWFSSINRPEDVAALGGEYLGPKLPDGTHHVQLQRAWPECAEGSE